KKYSRYWFETWIDGRTEISFEIWFKSNIAIKDNIDFSIKPFFMLLGVIYAHFHQVMKGQDSIFQEID
ncbi:hypothetical protein, partial [Campylobacter coli]